MYVEGSGQLWRQMATAQADGQTSGYSLVPGPHFESRAEVPCVSSLILVPLIRSPFLHSTTQCVRDLYILQFLTFCLSQHRHPNLLLFLTSEVKAELQRIHTDGCRYNERLNSKTEGSKLLEYTGLSG
jgi:hypothetical protein